MGKQGETERGRGGFIIGEGVDCWAFVIGPSGCDRDGG